MAHLPLPTPGIATRLLIAGLALLPLLVVVICSIPALVAWPFLPVTRAELPKRMDQLMTWTVLVLRTVMAAGGSDR